MDSEILVALLVAGFLVAFLRQRGRLQALERRIASAEAAIAAFRSGGPPAAAVAPPPPASEPERPAAEPVAAPPEPPPSGGLPPDPPRPVPEAAPPRRPGLEERLGTRWTVWVGGVALALGGLLLVRFAIEEGLVGPALRVALGALLALALAGAGEGLRRRGVAPDAGPANIPAVLTAAGVSTAFAVVYAAYALYGLIGPLPAFLLLGVVGLAAMAASALHGPALAALGLVGALGAPLLVESEAPNFAGLAAYLAAVVASAYAVARLRLYRWLALAAALGALLWGFVMAVADQPVAAAAHILVQTGLAALFLVAEPHRRMSEPDGRIDRFASAILAGFACLAALLSLDLGLGALRPAFAAAMAATLLATAWRYPPAGPAAGLAAFVAAAALAFWPVDREAGAESITVLDSMVGGAPMPAAIGSYLATAFLFGAALLSAGLLRVLRGADLRPAAALWHLGAATIGPLAILVVAYLRIASLERSVPFALVAAALAAGFAVAARSFRAQESATADAAGPLHLAVGATAAAAIAALALGLVFALDRGALTVALALAAFGAAYVADRAAVPALRAVVAGLGLAVAARLAWDPRIMGSDLGRTPILNWLLWGYGVPALAFGLAARIMARSGRDRAVRVAETLAILFSALLVFLQIRHALHDGDIYAARFGHLEAGLVVTQGLGFSILMARLGARDAHPFYRLGSLVFASLSLLAAAGALLLADNPYLTGEPIPGGAVLNTLAPAYLLPAAMAAALAGAARGVQPRAFVLAAAALALVLELAYAGLEIRRLFQGPAIGFMRWTGQGELWAYSAVLILNGAALLAAGFARRSREARMASAACIVAAVLKVFVIDLANLEGLMRALSFVGLGVALVAMGFVYQRLAARRPPA